MSIKMPIIFLSSFVLVLIVVIQIFSYISVNNTKTAAIINNNKILR